MNAVLNRSLQLKINSEIDADERLIWSGQPKAGSLAIRGLPLFLFGLPWTAFALFWTWAAAGFRIPDFSQGWDFFPLFGIPFILIGLGLLSTPLWLALFSGQTAYVLTDKRAIILRKTWTKLTVREFFPDDLGAVYREEGRGSVGNVIFAAAPTGQEAAIPSQEIGFMGIEDVRQVEGLLKELARTKTKKAP